MARNRTEDREVRTVETTRLAEVADEKLLLEYRETGQQEFLSELIHRYERELFNYLRRFLGDASLAEDAFQATFMQVHLKCHTFDGMRRVRPWLYTVATNQAIDIQRRNKRHQLVSLDRAQRADHTEIGSLMNLLVSSDPSPSDRFDLRERVEWLREAVARLPEQLESAISLVYFRGMKYREAAQELAVPVGTVKSRLHSAVQQLGQQWDQANSRKDK